MSKKWWRNARLVTVAALVLAGVTAATAQAAVLIKTDLKTWKTPVVRSGGEDVQSAGGGGWRAKIGGRDGAPLGRLTIDLAKAGVDAKEGTFDFIVGRAQREGKETLFTLYDKDNEPIYSLKINWDNSRGYDVSAPILQTIGLWRTYSVNDRKRGSGDPWIPVVPFAVGNGQTFRITITWGGGKPDGLFIDGVKQATRGNAGYQGFQSFGEILKQSTTMDIGAEVSVDTSRYAHLMGSVLNDFRALDVATATRVEDEVAPAISAVTHNAAEVAGFSGKLVAGNIVQISATGTPGVAASFDLVHFPDIASKIVIDWRGWGVYLEDKIFFEEGEVNLRDVESYLVYSSPVPFDYAVPGIEPLAQLETGEQQYTLETPEADIPYYIAVVALMRDGSRRPVIAPISNQPMTETSPGVYAGSYQVGWQDRYPRVAAIARFTTGAGAASLAADKTFVMDPALTLAVGTQPQELKADEKSVAKVTVTVTDANGNPVPEHEVKFLLFTTSQYTGVVGGGAFKEQVGGTVEESSFGKTDLFGRVTATYVAGFAAKTAIIVARDMFSNDTGSGWVKTFITATAQLELEPVVATAAMDVGYQITVTSSDDWLTADGKSTARITARVTKNDKPVEGNELGFSVSSGSGSIRVVKGTTDRNGEARAVYTAGKKIGMVLIMATDMTAGISASVQIELRSDAPAKIAITLDPQKLPADGRSRADLQVLVTDINDNPNDGVEVEYALAEGGGRIRDEKGLTDRNGKSDTQYVAGSTPGRVSIEITVRSTVPTPEEMAKVNDAALAVTDYKFF